MRTDSLGSEHINLVNCCSEGVTLNLSPGSILVICTDDGPSGICGQSMSVTCPHTVLHWFPTDEDYHRVASRLDRLSRRGKNAKTRVVKIGGWSSDQFSLVKHESGGD